MSGADGLQVANAFKQRIPNLSLLVVAEEVSLEIEKAALAQNGRALYTLMGNHGKAGS